VNDAFMQEGSWPVVRAMGVALGVHRVILLGMPMSAL
jgi:hypothetical protein